jgi:hypothetical protein
MGNKNGILRINKTSKRVLVSLRGVIGSSFDNPTFSFAASEGWRLGWEVFVNEG